MTSDHEVVELASQLSRMNSSMTAAYSDNVSDFEMGNGDASRFSSMSSSDVIRTSSIAPEEGLDRSDVGSLPANELSEAGDEAAKLPRSTSTEDALAPRVKFLCSHGGQLVHRSDGRLVYVGGETRVMAFPRDISYSDLMFKINEFYNGSFNLKYKFPNEGLDILISVTSDEDLANMMEECDALGRAASSEGPSRLRIFLFPSVEFEKLEESVGSDSLPSDDNYQGAQPSSYGEEMDSFFAPHHLGSSNPPGPDSRNGVSNIQPGNPLLISKPLVHSNPMANSKSNSNLADIPSMARNQPGNSNADPNALFAPQLSLSKQQKTYTRGQLSNQLGKSHSNVKSDSPVETPNPSSPSIPHWSPSQLAMGQEEPPVLELPSIYPPSHDVPPPQSGIFESIHSNDANQGPLQPSNSALDDTILISRYQNPDLKSNIIPQPNLRRLNINPSQISKTALSDPNSPSYGDGSQFSATIRSKDSSHNLQRSPHLQALDHPHPGLGHHGISHKTPSDPQLGTMIKGFESEDRVASSGRHFPPNYPHQYPPVHSYHPKHYQHADPHNIQKPLQDSFLAHSADSNFHHSPSQELIKGEGLEHPLQPIAHLTNQNYLPRIPDGAKPNEMVPNLVQLDDYHRQMGQERSLYPGMVPPVPQNTPWPGNSMLPQTSMHLMTSMENVSPRMGYINHGMTPFSQEQAMHPNHFSNPALSSSPSWQQHMNAYPHQEHLQQFKDVISPYYPGSNPYHHHLPHPSHISNSYEFHNLQSFPTKHVDPFPDPYQFNDRLKGFPHHYQGMNAYPSQPSQLQMHQSPAMQFSLQQEGHLPWTPEPIQYHQNHPVVRTTSQLPQQNQNLNPVQNFHTHQNMLIHPKQVENAPNRGINYLTEVQPVQRDTIHDLPHFKDHVPPMNLPRENVFGTSSFEPTPSRPNPSNYPPMSINPDNVKQEKANDPFLPMPRVASGHLFVTRTPETPDSPSESFPIVFPPSSPRVELTDTALKNESFPTDSTIENNKVPTSVSSVKQPQPEIAPLIAIDYLDSQTHSTVQPSIVSDELLSLNNLNISDKVVEPAAIQPNVLDPLETKHSPDAPNPACSSQNNKPPFNEDPQTPMKLEEKAHGELQSTSVGTMKTNSIENNAGDWISLDMENESSSHSSQNVLIFEKNAAASETSFPSKMSSEPLLESKSSSSLSDNTHSELEHTSLAAERKNSIDSLVQSPKTASAPDESEHHDNNPLTLLKVNPLSCVNERDNTHDHLESDNPVFKNLPVDLMGEVTEDERKAVELAVENQNISSSKETGGTNSFPMTDSKDLESEYHSAEDMTTVVPEVDKSLPHDLLPQNPVSTTEQITRPLSKRVEFSPISEQEELAEIVATSVLPPESIDLIQYPSRSNPIEDVASDTVKDNTDYPSKNESSEMESSLLSKFFEKTEKTLEVISANLKQDKVPEELNSKDITPNEEKFQTISNKDLEIIKELGSGTYGTVYLAKWRGTDVAVKRIRANVFLKGENNEDRLINEFWREARIQSTLHHPNVVAFYGIVKDTPDGSLSTVTEYMNNGSLKQVLQKKDRSIDRRKRIIIAIDAAIGMEYLHSKNVVHFDLKCDNLLVNMKDARRPICKVGDLGLSKIKHKTMVSGGVRGTLPWMAPELLDDHNTMVTEKVDVFSFGIVMWELLTGEEPYMNMHCGAIIGGILNGTLRPPIPSFCDPAWRSLMQRCWATDPKERPSFKEIADELRGMDTSPSQR